jgi:short-subunit dehydrogenase
MKSHGIKVTAVFPGAVYTDAWAESGADPKKMMVPEDVADLIYAASRLSGQGTVEDIVLRPLTGDL